MNYQTKKEETKDLEAVELENEYKGSRCPECFYALYDGDYCQGPKWCPNKGKSIENPVYLTNLEAFSLISAQMNPTTLTYQSCGRYLPCRHCKE